MAEVDGIDMFIVFADVIGEGSDGGVRSDMGTIISSPFTASPSVYVGSRPSSSPALTVPRSAPAPGLSRSARTSGRPGQEVNSSRRLRQHHSARSAQIERQEELALPSELPPPQGVFRRDSMRREIREEPSGTNAPTNVAGGHGINPDGSGYTALDSHGGTFVSRFLSSIPMSSRPQTWTQVHSTLGTPTATGVSTNSAPQLSSRAMPPALEQILQRAFSQISGESMMSEFMRRILESQRRGNPPASRFAIDNLEGSTNLSCQICTICQDDICKGCEAIHMPCKHAFHRECLVPWLQEHNTCPICRCEIESHCPRYNQSNFDKLKGPLQPITVSNHEDPSRMAPPGASIGLAGSHPSGSSHVRMTIRMPYPTPQLFDRTEPSGVRSEPAARPLGAEASARPPTRYVRPSIPRHTPSVPHHPTTVSASRAVGLAGTGNDEVEDSPAPKRRRRGDADVARAPEEGPAAPVHASVREWRVTFEDAAATPSHSNGRGRRVTFEDAPAAGSTAPALRRISKRERPRSPTERGSGGADVHESQRDDSPIAARTRTSARRQE